MGRLRDGCGPRADAVDPDTSERVDDVLMFRVDSSETKELVLADPRGIFFTTPRVPDVAEANAKLAAAGAHVNEMWDSCRDASTSGCCRR